MKSALALEPIHWQERGCGASGGYPSLPLKMDAARPKSAPAKIVADVGLARRGKNPGVAEGATSE
jgi:hypothetical protein